MHSQHKILSEDSGEGGARCRMQDIKTPASRFFHLKLLTSVFFFLLFALVSVMCYKHQHTHLLAVNSPEDLLLSFHIDSFWTFCRVFTLGWGGQTAESSEALTWTFAFPLFL